MPRCRRRPGAFAGESQANRRYLSFARVADIEGFPDIAGLFKDTADAETGHAFGHLDLLKEVGDPLTGGTNRETRAQPESGRGRRDVGVHPDVSRHGQDGARRGFVGLAEWFETLAKAEKSQAGRSGKGLNQIAAKDPAEAM